MLGKTTNDDFEQLIKACEAAGKVDPIEKWGDCVPTDPFEIQSVGTATIHKIIGQGHSGLTFAIESSSSSDLVIKVSTSLHRSLCREIAALSILEGLEGSVPRYFKITAGIAPACAARAMVMDKIGDEDLDKDFQSFDGNFKMRFAKLLGVVHNLHEHGFVHTDLHPGNIRIKKDDPNYIGLIDFGLAVMPGNEKAFSRQDDWMQIPTLVEELSETIDDKEPLPHWFPKLLVETENLAPDQALDVATWISLVLED